MANILDYVDWRGDLSFEAAPFNEIDNYILSQVIYLDYEGIVPADEKPMALSSVLEKYLEKFGEEGNYVGAIVPPLAFSLVRKIAGCRRFQNVGLCFFEDLVNGENTEQFAAVTILLPENKLYISFRGTDDTLIGWKEDCLMSYEDTVQAQDDALSYLVRTADAYPEYRIILGGHSKGGNLAIYAGAKAEETVQDRIEMIYANDSQGFSEEFLLENSYRRIKEKILLISPKATVVSSFFTHDCRQKVVECTKTGLWAHDGFCWEVLGNSFVEAEGLNSLNLAFRDALKSTTESLTTEEKRAFTEDLFAVLTVTGAQTLTDLSRLMPKEVTEVLGELVKRKATLGKFMDLIASPVVKEIISQEVQGTERTIRQFFRLTKEEKES